MPTHPDSYPQFPFGQVLQGAPRSDCLTLLLCQMPPFLTLTPLPQCEIVNFLSGHVVLSSCHWPSACTGSSTSRKMKCGYCTLGFQMGTLARRNCPENCQKKTAQKTSQNPGISIGPLVLWGITGNAGWAKLMSAIFQRFPQFTEISAILHIFLQLPHESNM